MTAAERKQAERARRKLAGDVRIEVWVPADKADAVRDAIANVMKDATPKLNG